MNAPLRRAGVAMMLLFALLLLNLTVVQFVDAERYRTDQVNNRVRIQQAEYDRQRGQIIVDGVAAADSVATKDDLKYLRTYPLGPAYATVVGYQPVDLAPVGVERLESDFLDGTADAFTVDRLFEAFTGKVATGGNVVLTIRKQVQDAAYQALLHNTTSSKVGAVVAIDPTTGAILAAVSTPSYDPNPLASHDPDTALAAYNSLNTADGAPLSDRALSQTYPPGSTFKVIVAAAALAAGDSPSTVLQGGTSYTAKNSGSPIYNAPGVVCPDSITLIQALTVSCNTAYARLGTEDLGADRIKQAASAFGFETTPVLGGDPDNVMNVAASHTGDMANPDGTTDPAALAQSCIGQRDVRMTPLQGAMIAAAIANDGVQMQPYLIDRRQGSDLTPVDQTQPTELRQPVTAGIAQQLRQMMDSVVMNGTGKNAQISGYEVGGKTGTAQNGNNLDHGWFIGYAIKDGQPIVAVAVFLQNAGSGGSSQATDIAGQVMKAAILTGKIR
jgi:peptidoglycan glycosyltransferase